MKSPMKIGIGSKASDTELRVQDMSFAEFAEKLSKPKIGAKDGLYVIRGGLLREPKRADANLLEAELAIVDGDSSFDAETGEILPGAPDFDTAVAALDRSGLAYVAHTTHSNQPGKPKWRAYIAAHMTDPSQLVPCVTEVVEYLNANGCHVIQTRETGAWSQCWFAPRVPSEEALQWFRYAANPDGEPMDVARAVKAYRGRAKAEEAVQQRQDTPKPANATTGPSPIETFNAAATVGLVRQMLEDAGYKFAFKRGDTLRFMAPQSETRTAGVVVFKGAQRGDIVAFSHHGAHDPLSGRLTDAFGILWHVTHRGNQEAAMAQARATIGWAEKRDPLADFDHLEITAEDFKAAGGKAAAAPEKPEATIAANAFVLPDEGAVPPRQWVYGWHLIRRFVSATIAPGGVGKSSLVMTEAMAMATGKPLLGVQLKEPLRVWVWCLEDPREELDRRAVAIAKKYSVTAADIGGRLFLNSGRDMPLCIAEQERRTGTIIVGPHIEALKAEITRHRIDVISIDPFVSSHQVSENDNVAINTVMRQWVALAEQCNIAVELVHHTRKNGDGEVTAETSRGAKALIDATRDTRVLNQMTRDEAERFRVDNNRLFFRVYSDKMNLAPPAERSDWYQLESIQLANGNQDYPGDRIGVPVRWEVPGPWAGVSMDTINTILTAIELGVLADSGQPTGEPYSDSKRGRGNSRWVGTLIMDATGMDEEAAKRAIRSWIDSSLLTVIKVEIRKKEVNGIQVNKQIWNEMLSHGE